MGLLDRFIKQEMQGIPPEEIARQEQMQQQMEQMQVADTDRSQFPGGRPLPPAAIVPMPPTIEKEVMDLYLKIRVPPEPEKLTGQKRYWVFMDSDAATEVPTANMNAASQREILTELTTAIDFDGCDNVDGLIQDTQIKIHAKVITNKARSDFGDGLRERVIPSVGIGMSGMWNQKEERGERPHENKGLFGAFRGGR